MKTDNDDVSLPINDFYDQIIMDAEAMQRFLARYSEIEHVDLYQYVLRRAKALSDDKLLNQDMISYCWLASMELEQTEGVKKYLNGEITQEDIDKFNTEKEAEVQEIVELLERRKKDKKSMVKQFVRMFRK